MGSFSIWHWVIVLLVVVGIPLAIVLSVVKASSRSKDKPEK